MCLYQTVFPLMNVSQSFKVYVNLEDLSRNLYFHHFAMLFCLHQKNNIEWQTYYYHSKQVNICDYNPTCLMPSGLMFDEIMTNLFRNRIEKQHVEVVDIYFTKHRTTTFLCTQSHFKMFIVRKLLVTLCT